MNVSTLNIREFEYSVFVNVSTLYIREFEWSVFVHASTSTMYSCMRVLVLCIRACEY